MKKRREALALQLHEHEGFLPKPDTRPALCPTCTLRETCLDRKVYERKFCSEYKKE